MKISIVAAMTEDRVIGENNQLPWRLPEDLKHFKKLTMGHAIIMGRKTFESLGKALPGRTNIVVTKNSKFLAEGAQVVGSFEEALQICEKIDLSPFVIGGAMLFSQALPKAEEIYLTILHTKISGDTYFPPFNLEKEFKIVEQQDQLSAGTNPIPFTFLHLKRRE